MNETDILQRLRDSTRIAHERLEVKLDLLNQLARPDARLRIVMRFAGLHQDAERALAPILSGVEGLGYADRRRAKILESDLAALGWNGAPRPQIRPMPTPSGPAEALGVLYVLEGSTLGGRIIRREMLARGQSMAGLAFLEPYGSRTGECWRAFLAVLDRETARGGPDFARDVVRGGAAGFRSAELWLCAEEAVHAA